MNLIRGARNLKLIRAKNGLFLRLDHRANALVWKRHRRRSDEDDSTLRPKNLLNQTAQVLFFSQRIEKLHVVGSERDERQRWLENERIRQPSAARPLMNGRPYTTVRSKRHIGLRRQLLEWESKPVSQGIADQ